LEVRPLVRIVRIEVEDALPNRRPAEAWSGFDDHLKAGSGGALKDATAVLRCLDRRKDGTVGTGKTEEDDLRTAVG